MSAPVKKCEVCDDTGSKSRDLSGDIDCVACSAADERTALNFALCGIRRTNADEIAWRAYQLGKAAAAMPAPNYEEEMAKVKSDVEGLMGYGFMVDKRRVGLDRIVWFNRPGEQSLHARPLPDNDEAIQDEFNEWIGPRRSGESPQEAAVLYWAQEAYRAGRLAAPVVPVAAQPVVQQEPVAWLVYAEDHDSMVPQFPAYQVKPEALRYAATFGQTRTEIWPIYAAPSLEAQPAGEVIPAEKLCALLPGTYYMDQPDGGSMTVLEQVERLAKDAARYRWLRNSWDGVSAGKELDETVDCAMAQGEKP